MNATPKDYLIRLDVLMSIFYSFVWLSGVICILHLTYKFIREYTYVTVNCWFCNQNLRVLFKERNEWFCKFCDQFNGFTKAGDYSRPIPEQYNENLNSRSIKRGGYRSKIPNLNGLCRTCNFNQELKIRQIASFVPFREEDYDKEIELFKDKLEKSYKLCNICERTVQSTLKLKVNWYSAKIPKRNENFVKDEVKMNKALKKWKYLPILLAGIILMTVLWKFNHFFLAGLGTRLQIVDYLFEDYMTSINYNILLNVAAVVLTTLFVRAIRGKAALLSPLVFGILAFSIDDKVFVIIKVMNITLILIYFSYKCWKMNKNCNESNRKLPYSCKKFKEAEKLSYVKEETSFQKNKLNTVNTPLCGKFSGMSLGRMQAQSVNYASSSYLFKPNNVLVQPPKLIVDDVNMSGGSTGSSPTISSGYYSAASFMQRSADSISEFDSVSQIGHRYHSPSQDFTNLMPFHPCGPIYCTSPPRYYGASSVLSDRDHKWFMKSKQSDPQFNAFYSTLQIFLCSLAFFILGISFPMLVGYIHY